MSEYYTCTMAEADSASANLFIRDIRACDDCPLGPDSIHACPGWFPDFGIDVLFIGMSPGATENEKGRPFVGAAGKKLLVLANSVGLLDDDTTFGFTNIVRCMTPSNRPPTGQEVDACKRWLDIELDMAAPLVLVLLGGTAIELAFPGKKIGEVAGDARVMPIGERIYAVVASYHPAAILHRPDEYVEESIKKSLMLARQLIAERRQGAVSS